MWVILAVAWIDIGDEQDGPPVSRCTPRNTEERPRKGQMVLKETTHETTYIISLTENLMSSHGSETK